MFEAKVIKHSISEAGKEILTMQLCYPRFIHGEVMTHRVFSRNAMSSRAIPLAKMIQQVRNNPAMPIHWGANQAGMQAFTELAGPALVAVRQLWLVASAQAANTAETMAGYGVAKQIGNRILEPFQWMSTIVTSTEWDNFFELRDHEDAQPEFRHLAQLMRKARDSSEPQLLRISEWHLPYVDSKEKDVKLRKISSARCARVSYLTHDGLEPSEAKDLELFERLVGQRPLHASALEHAASPFGNKRALSRNFVGWLQFRDFWEENQYDIL